MEKPQGRYPIARRAGEIERLERQSDALAADAAVMLDRIGVAPGWRCIDLGCGPGGITDLLSARVGAAGRVTGLDADAAFLDHARARAQARGLANVDYVQGDAYRTELASASFDLVHTRFVASTAGDPERLLAEAILLARPGGIVALQEPDIEGLACYPPHPAWQRLRRALDDVFGAVGANVRLAQDLYRMLRRAGLADVQYRPFLVGFRPGDAMAFYLPETVESVRAALIERRLIDAQELDAALVACRAHLARPDTVSTFPIVAQVWGRKA
jgi:ubiquinone/menaquinone biosynthesis C-methylase UbiE